MTWIVGASTLFGYGAVISDVQVSDSASGLRMDALQKAHPVGKYIVAGFAGDVRPGLVLLGSLSSFLNSPPPPDDECWDPQWVVDNWPDEARKVYQQIGEEARFEGTDILMMGLKSTGNREKRVMGDAIGHLSVFRSPDFLPESEQGGRKAKSIGCGANVEKYTTMLEALMCDDDLTYMQSEVYNPGGYGRRIAENLRWIVQQNPEDGISEHFQLFIVRMGEIRLFNSTGMPMLAQNWTELVPMLEEYMNPQSLVAKRS